MRFVRVLVVAACAAFAGWTSVRGETGDVLHRPLPEAITSFGAATLDGKLYVYSGHSETNASTGPESLSKSFRRLDLEDPNAAWEELAMHEPAQSTALVVHDGALYRVGGLAFDLNENGESLFRSTSYFARYDVTKNAWTELAPLPEPRSSLDAAVVGECLYVVGGWNLQGESATDAPWHDDLLKFDFHNPDAGWQSIPEPACGKVRALAAASHGGKLFVLGGMQEEGGITEEVHVFDPATGAWSNGPNLIRDSAMAGFAISAFGAGGKLYCNGGSGVVFRLSDDGAKWEVADRLFFPRMFHRLVPRSDSALVALGGIAGGERTTTVETIDVAAQSGPKFVAWSVPFDGQVKQGQNVVLVGSKLYAFGGNVSREPHDFSEEAFSAEAYRFDLGSRTVEKLPDLPQPLQSGAVVSHRQTSEHRTLCVVGGLGFGRPCCRRYPS